MKEEAFEGRYIDSIIKYELQGNDLHIVQYNKEKESKRVYEIGRITLDAREFFAIYTYILDRQEGKEFDAPSRYAAILLQMYGNISIRSARELWRIATYQVDNFLVLTGTEDELFRVLAMENPEEQLRLEEAFGDQVIASCRRRRLKILRKGFKK